MAVIPRATRAAIRGGLGFLTRLPVGQDDSHWARFRERPAAFVPIGYVVGLLLVPAILLPVPAATAAAVFVGWVYFLTGINHADGLADLGDAAVVHGDAARRHEVLTDTTTGVGAMLAVALVIFGLALGAFEVASAPIRAVGLVVAAEVGAKLGMAGVVCFGSAAFDGLGAELTERATTRSFVGPTLLALPAAFATWPRPAAAIALLAAIAATVVMLAWAHSRLEGVNGDVIGATNEIGRVVALHAGVVAWTRF